MNVTGFGTPAEPSAGVCGVARPDGHVGSGELTCEVTLAVLFAELGSVVVEETLAVFVTVPAFAGAVALIVSVALLFAASAASVHVSVFDAIEQLNAPLVVPNSTPAGSVSVSVRFDAAPAPPFVTVIE